MNQLTVSRYVDIHSHQASQDNSERIAIENIFLQDIEADFHFTGPASIGLHPWHTGGFVLNKELLLASCRNEKVLAIGEIGLDQLKGDTKEAQIQAFTAQALIAEQLKIPVIIHCVKSFEEIIRIKNSIKPTVPWIIHGFRGGSELSRQLVALGFHLSFGGALLNSWEKLWNALISTPLDRLFLETDDGEQSIEHVYSMAAEVMKMYEEELRLFIYENFKRVFTRYARH